MMCMRWGAAMRQGQKTLTKDGWKVLTLCRDTPQLTPTPPSLFSSRVRENWVLPVSSLSLSSYKVFLSNASPPVSLSLKSHLHFYCQCLYVPFISYLEFLNNFPSGLSAFKLTSLIHNCYTLNCYPSNYVDALTLNTENVTTFGDGSL